MPSDTWRSILVAVRDPDLRKQVAIRKAARIAAASGARIMLFHAFSVPYPVPEPIPTDPAKLLGKVAGHRRAQLLEARAAACKGAGLRVQCEAVWDFPPAQAIVRQVLRSKPDLVVAESHRHTRLARRLLANADWDLIRECPCPVWFVKSERFARKPLVMTAVDPTHAHAKPSGLDDRLLDAATSVMRQLDARMALVHVQDTREIWPPGSRPPSEGVAAVARLAKRHGVADATRIVRRGIPADALKSIAAELKPDVLVMGAVSRSGPEHAFVGNTGEAVIDGVTCDLLVVKPRRFKTAVPRQGPRLRRR